MHDFNRHAATSLFADLKQPKFFLVVQVQQAIVIGQAERMTISHMRGEPQ